MIGLIYKKNYTFFNENHFDKTTYYFFMKALRRNDDLDVDFFPVEAIYSHSDSLGSLYLTPVCWVSQLA